MRTAILFITHIYNEEINQQVDKLRNETRNMADLYVCQQTDLCGADVSEQSGLFLYTPDDLNELNCNVWECSMPGGNVHLVMLSFFRLHPRYDHYWVIEYDVRFTGCWRKFFSFFEDRDEDFISAHVETVDDNPEWSRWNEIELVNISLNRDGLLKSFNPICRLSGRALRLLDERCRLGDRGHFEVLLPTLFRYYKLNIADFGGRGRFSYRDFPDLFYRNDPDCHEEDGCTHRFRPLHTKDTMTLPDMIYHPIK